MGAKAIKPGLWDKNPSSLSNLPTRGWSVETADIAYMFSVFFQGIQRRLVVTMIHENSPDIRIRRVVDLVVGKCNTYHLFQ